MPLVLLEQAETNALNLRTIGATIVALCQLGIIAAFILNVVLEGVSGFRILQQLLIHRFQLGIGFF